MPEIDLPPQFGPSREWIIDQRIKELITFYIDNKGFTPKQKIEFDDLNQERVWLMIPKFFGSRQRPVRSRFGSTRRVFFK